MNETEFLGIYNNPNIKIPINYTIDSNENVVLDKEEMMKAFELEISTMECVVLGI